MSFSIHIANNLEALSEAFLPMLAQDKRGVFNPQYIVVQTAGMNNWLKYKIAAHLGIASNLKFLSPTDIFFKAYLILGGKVEKKIDRQHLDWLIYTIMGKSDFAKKFPQQAGYFQDGDKQDEVKQWELSSKVADLFDQYQIYRSDMIEDWNVTDWDSLTVEWKWQAYIWQQMKLLAKDKFVDSVQMKRFILDQLKDENASLKLKEKMPSVYMFGLSIITPYHLELLYALSQSVEIQWFISNPAPNDYWIEDETEKSIFLKKLKGKNITYLNTGNSLLINWGKVLQSTFRMIFQTEEFINSVNELPSSPPQKNTLLASIQTDIFNNNSEPIPVSEAQLKDKSLSIISCYSKKREVETVYNFLLNAVLEKTYGDLSERDIVVMVSDINAYTPFIKSVMDNAPYKFQYSIADRGIAEGDNLITALLKLLELSEQAFTAEAVLHLLSAKQIRQKFGLNDIDLLRTILSKSGIRFGFENDYKNPIDDTYLVSWKYGLQRIMWGLCIAEEQLIPAEREFLTLDAVDSATEMQQITGLVALINALTEMLKARTGLKTIMQWNDHIEKTIAALLLDETTDPDEKDMKLIEKKLNFEDLEELLQQDKVSFTVFKKHFIDGLEQADERNQFLNRGITFCAPLPFRSIPFKVVAILGLNGNDFPRKAQQLEFDLMTKAPKLGDRNIKQNDRHLFLESLLAAKDALYLSYLGKSAKDNTDLEPSILIDELLDYIKQAAEGLEVKEFLVQQHPLYSYSSKYNKNRVEMLPNYLIEQEKTWPLLEKEYQIELNESSEFKVKNVWKFFDKASQYYHNQVLQIYFEKESRPIDSTELFTLDGLSSWKLMDTLIRSNFESEEDLIVDLMYKQGELPLKNIKEIWVSEKKEKIQPLIDNFKQEIGEISEQNRKIFYEFEGNTFEGIVTLIKEKTLVDYGFYHGSDKYKMVLKISRSKARLKFNYLFAQACSDEQLTAILFFNESIFKLKPLSRAEAKEELDILLKTFLELRKEPVLYSLEFYSKKMDEDNFLVEMQKKMKDAREYELYIQSAKKTFPMENQLDFFIDMQYIINDILIEGYEQ